MAVSDAAGQSVGRVQYDPYGEVLTSTLPVTLTVRLFTGQRFDSSSGLYYYNARYYDPHLGRFVQPDSLVPDPLNPQAWNRFSYVYNNPASYVDPGGHIAWVPILIFGGAFLLGVGAGGYYAYHQGYGFESWQLYAYAGMGGLAGVVGAATGMWIEAALLPVGATAGQAFLAGGFAAGVVEQSILETGGAAILGTKVSAERILLAGGIGGVTGGTTALVRRAIRSHILGKFVGYHGTSSVHEASIRQGINPPTGANFGGYSQLGEGFYITPEREAAEYFANQAVQNVGGEPVVLRVFARGFERMSGASVPESLWWKVSSTYITDYDYLMAPISGLEHWSQIKFNPSTYGYLMAVR